MIDIRKTAKLLAAKFIAYPEAYAVQTPTGSFDSLDAKIDMQVLLDHIEGRRTISHRLAGTDGKCKFFAIELQLMDTANSPRLPITVGEDNLWETWSTWDIRDHWMRRVPEPPVARQAMKYFFRLAAGNMVRTIEEHLSVQACAAYTPPYSVTVYGLTGRILPGRAQKAAEIILESQGWAPNPNAKGTYLHSGRSNTDDPLSGFPCLEAKIIPHRALDKIEMGNTMKLPLGRDSRSPKDKSFFLDLRFPLTELVPRDPVETLTAQSQFAGEIPQEMLQKYGYVHQVILERVPEGSK